MALTNLVAFTTTAQVEAVVGSGTYLTALIEQRILSVSAMMETYCGRRFRTATFSTSAPEQVQGNGRTVLLLNRYPITAVSQVTIDGTAVTDYSQSADFDAAGLLYRVTRWPASAPTYGDITEDVDGNFLAYNISVAYTGGYVLPNDSSGTRSLPYDLEQVCIDEVVHRLQQPMRGLHSERLTTGDGQQYGERVGGFATESADILDRYKRGLY